MTGGWKATHGGAMRGGAQTVPSRMGGRHESR